MSIDYEAFEEMDTREVRASALEEGDVYCEYGMDPEVVAKRGGHGDTVLITTAEGVEIALDSDTVVEVANR